MSHHSSAAERNGTPHTIDATNNQTISDATKRRDNLPPTNEANIATLAGIICGADEPAAALLVLMATLENAPNPKALANAVKHLAFTHCAEANLYGMVDAQIAMLESELLAANSLVS